jgi:hypothetical protein
VPYCLPIQLQGAKKYFSGTPQTKNLEKNIFDRN